MLVWRTLFSYRGRINRKTFWLAGMLPILVGWIALGTVLINVRVPAIDVPVGLVSRLALLAWLVALFVAWYAVLVKRCRDLGHSGWLSVLTLVPLFGFAMWLWLGFARGKPDANGHSLSKDSTGS